jgi:hypothetical protein
MIAKDSRIDSEDFVQTWRDFAPKPCPTGYDYLHGESVEVWLITELWSDKKEWRQCTITKVEKRDNELKWVQVRYIGAWGEEKFQCVLPSEGPASSSSNAPSITKDIQTYTVDIPDAYTIEVPKPTERAPADDPEETDERFFKRLGFTFHAVMLPEAVRIKHVKPDGDVDIGDKLDFIDDTQVETLTKQSFMATLRNGKQLTFDKRGGFTVAIEDCRVVYVEKHSWADLQNINIGDKLKEIDDREVTDLIKQIVESMDGPVTEKRKQEELNTKIKSCKKLTFEREVWQTIIQSSGLGQGGRWFDWIHPDRGGGFGEVQDLFTWERWGNLLQTLFSMYLNYRSIYNNFWEDAWPIVRKWNIFVTVNTLGEELCTSIFSTLPLDMEDVNQFQTPRTLTRTCTQQLSLDADATAHGFTISGVFCDLFGYQQLRKKEDDIIAILEVVLLVAFWARFVFCCLRALISARPLLDIWYQIKSNLHGKKPKDLKLEECKRLKIKEDENDLHTTWEAGHYGHTYRAFNTIGILKGISCMSILHYVAPTVIMLDFKKMEQRLKDDEKTSTEKNLRRAWFLVTRLICMWVGFDALMIKLRNVGKDIAPGKPARTAIWSCLMFMNQMLGIIKVPYLLTNRVRNFMFAGEDAVFQKDEKVRLEVWHAKVAEHVFKHRCYRGYLPYPLWNVVVMMSFSAEDMQKLALNDRDHREHRASSPGSVE